MQPVVGQHWQLSILGQGGGGRCFIFRNSIGEGCLAEQERHERQRRNSFTTIAIAVQISMTGDHRFLSLLLPSPAKPTTFIQRAKKLYKSRRMTKKIEYIFAPRWTVVFKVTVCNKRPVKHCRQYSRDIQYHWLHLNDRNLKEVLWHLDSSRALSTQYISPRLKPVA
jgi:hypothetical protein